MRTRNMKEGDEVGGGIVDEEEEDEEGGMRVEDGDVVHILDITSLHRLASWGHNTDC